VRVAALACSMLALGSSAAPAVSAQTLYVDEQFGFALTTGVIFASKPVGNPAMPMDLRLELYEPTGAGVPELRPAVIAIHGGGFTGGTRFNPVMIGICERMAKRGYTCVSIQYRLQGDLPVVGPLFQPLETLITLGGDSRASAIAAGTEDTVAALQWMVDNAVGLGVDPNRIGLAGYSAGGALTEFVSYWINGGGGVPLPVQPRANFNLAGAFNPTPLVIVEAGEPPSIMVHGDADTVVDPAGSVYLDAQLTGLGIPSELYIIPGAGHTGFDIFSDEVVPGDTYFDRVVDFFALHVASVPPIPSLTAPGMTLLILSLTWIGTKRRRG
jgi:acetyl esterase/lipase